jgi:two-component sensor histidine kinase
MLQSRPWPGQPSPEFPANPSLDRLPAKITLSCTREGTCGLKLIYEDDGVGFPEDFDISAASHSGMSFIRLLSKSLHADPKWHSDPLGIRFEIQFASVD